MPGFEGRPKRLRCGTCPRNAFEPPEPATDMPMPDFGIPDEDVAVGPCARPLQVVCQLPVSQFCNTEILCLYVYAHAHVLVYAHLRTRIHPCASVYMCVCMYR